MVVPAESLRAAARAPDAAATSAPSLIVFITIDQFRSDYLDRFRSQYTGGLARLANRGAFFTKAYQDYGVTETAPGHASTMSGRFPRSTGIYSNANGVNNAIDSLLVTPRGGLPAGPERFRGTTVTDWLVAANPATKILSVSRKDRGAILPIGRSKQQVYWYSSGGIFTTSTYYTRELPAWVQAFNDRKLAQRYAGQQWNLLLPASAYTEPDSVAIESNGQDYVFPHALPTDSGQAARILPNYPFMDSLTVAFALEGLRALNLGDNANRTDLLAVSLSTTDAVGHRFGPDSREQHDQLLRVDKYLGQLMDGVYRMRDSTRVMFVLTADHGVNAFPEVQSKVEPNAGARRVDPRAVIMAARSGMADAKVDSTAIRMDEAWLTFERDALDPRTDWAKLADRVAARVRKVPGVLRADTRKSLASADTTKDTIARRWLHMFPPESVPDVIVTLEPHNDWLGSTIANHGTPHDYDAHVPIVFMGPWFKAGRYDEFARTADIAPTIAAVARVTPSERLDGHVLQAALGAPVPKVTKER